MQWWSGRLDAPAPASPDVKSSGTLHFDHDPYPVILGEDVKWVLDAYTTTNRYPYSQGAITTDLPIDSGLNHGFNYVRNSVKVVVDAYDGSVTFYVIDDEPIIDAYRDAFPGLFTDGDEMPEELREHFRYPEDIFRVQSSLWAQYHLTTSSDFFDVADRWQVTQDPGTAGAAASTTTTDDQGATGVARAARIAPYYQLLQLPGEEDAEFVAMRPYSPFSEDDVRPQLTAFIVGRSDGDDYGKLRVYEMPSAGAARRADRGGGDHPVRLRRERAGDPAQWRGERRSLRELAAGPDRRRAALCAAALRRGGEREPPDPQLQRVIAVLGDEVAIETTLKGALEELFGQSVDTGEVEPPPDDEQPPDEEPPDEEPPDEGPTEDGTIPEQIATLLEEANDLRNDADQALEKDGIEGLSEYQDLIEQANEKYDEVSDLIDQLLDENDEGNGDPGNDNSTTTTTEEPTPA